MKKNKTKQIILDKSLDIFSKNSFFSISMQDIADAIEIKKSLIYYYFESKSRLYQQAIENYFQKLYQEFEIIFSKKMSASEKIDTLSKIYLKELQKEKFVLFGYQEKNKLDKSISKLLVNSQKNIVKYFENTISEGIKNGEFREMDPKKSSLTLIGYLEKIKQYNLKLDRDWFDFLIK